MRIMGIANNQIRLTPDNFSNDKFECTNLLTTPNGKTAALVSNRYDMPKHWYVIFGTSRLCFKSSDEAITYCLNKGFKLADSSSIGRI
jgi:hypothetical protein